jgi:outer membrane protein insertion porin family
MPLITGRSPHTMMQRIGLIPFFLLLLIGICVAQEDVIQKITTLGNVKVEEGVVRAAIKSREGRPFSMDQVREDLRSIFGLGYFSDVQVDIKSSPQGKEIIFIVVEKSSIKEVLIKGNQKLTYDDIKEKVTLAPRSILNLDKVKENAEQIRKLYFSKGYYGVKVDSKIDTLETNEAVVTFQIQEGPKGRIKQIILKGNQKIKSSDLKKVMMTKQWNLLSFLTKSGVLDEDILKNDIQMLTAYYIDNGYLEAKISEPKVDLRDPTRIRVEIDISEGPQYQIGNIDFKGDVLTTKEELFRVIGIKRKDVYSNTAIRRDISTLTELFANQGYAYAEISPETAVDSKNLTVHLTFVVEKKKQVSFEKIQIAGNTKTRDKVIRRELQVAEGELYSAGGLNKSRDRLKRTGYFKEVDFTTSRGSTDDRLNLDIKVEESPTGSISFGAGYSSVFKVMGSVSLSDRNLFGLGYHAVFKVSMGTGSKEYKLSFTDPYFLGSPYAVGGDLYRQEVTTFETYAYKITGGDIHVGKDITETLRLDALYKLEKVNVYDVQADASQNIKDQAGNSTTSAISTTLTKDTRDDFFAPSRGSRSSLLLQNAGGPLAGDNNFVKTIGDTSWYFPMPLKTVLNLRGKVGFIESYGGKKTPIYEKFYVGGAGTVRGFEFGIAGPIDENGDPLGASRMIVFNSELVFPLSREIGLRGAVFWDVGKGFDNFSNITPIKTGVGVGLRWFSPFGPINIDIGFNPMPQKGEKARVIEFNAGSVF